MCQMSLLLPAFPTFTSLYTDVYSSTDKQHTLARWSILHTFKPAAHMLKYCVFKQCMISSVMKGYIDQEIHRNKYEVRKL